MMRPRARSTASATTEQPPRRWSGWIARLWLAWTCILTACTDSPIVHNAQRWPEADRLFQADARWIGGDGAYSCPLDGERVLWVFGDSLVAQDATRSRDRSWFLRNSIAIQTGRDPSTAFMDFHWGVRDGHPGSFIPEDGDRWFWPGQCVRVGSGLLLFGQWLRQAGSGQFGFGAVGPAALFVAHPEAAPEDWTPVDAHLPDVPGAPLFGAAALVHGDYVYALGGMGDVHDGVLARFALTEAATGDLRHGEIAVGDGWLPATEFVGPPAPVLTWGAPEASLQFDAASGEFLLFQSEGFGATTLAVRRAASLAGPWSAPVSFFRPPESLEPGAFVYAGKAHPELIGADVILTYVPSRFEDDDRPSPDDYYYPHFVRAEF